MKKMRTRQGARPDSKYGGIPDISCIPGTGAGMTQAYKEGTMTQILYFRRWEPKVLHMQEKGSDVENAPAGRVGWTMRCECAGHSVYVVVTGTLRFIRTVSSYSECKMFLCVHSASPKSMILVTAAFRFTLEK